MNQKIKSGIEIGIIIGLFVLFSYLAQKNIGILKNSIIDSSFGIIIYLLIVITAVVIAPISAFPLHPFAANIFGWVLAGFILWIGVCIGAFIAFVLSRMYGKKLVKNFIQLNKIKKIEKKISRKNLFLSVMITRLILPIEIGSYFFGLFSNVKLSSYMIATIIGAMPLAFLSAYIGTLPVIFQINAVLVFLIVLITIIISKILAEKK